MHTSNRSRPLCRFFNTPRGCREGTNCRFLHATELQQPPAGRPSLAPHAGAANNTFNSTSSRSRQGANSDSRQEAPVNIGLFHRLLKRAVSSTTGLVEPQLLQQWVQICDQVVKGHRVPLLLEKLAQDEDGIRLCTMLLADCPDKVRQGTCLEWFCANWVHYRVQMGLDALN